MRTHVLDEKKSPPSALIWTMRCGDQCVAEDDGTLTPRLDFYLEQEAHKSDCVGCVAALSDPIGGEDTRTLEKV